MKSQISKPCLAGRQVKSQILFFSYGLSSLALFLYSYTQVDLGLTLSRVSIWQAIQRAFQFIGFFERPLSTLLYGIIVGVMFLLYLYTLSEVRKRNISKHVIWLIAIIISIVLLFSYPAFSYDLFNYMFTAKTVLIYHKNPYMITPLQFTGVEPWLSFMHWTHLSSAYTPLWILMTLPAYIMGFGYFLLIMWNIKMIAIASYLIATMFIGRILDAKDPKNTALGMAIFALNPLVIIESLVSGHNDVVMIAISLGAIYMFIKKREWHGYILLSLSVALKLMTVFLIPVMIVKKRRIYMLIAMIIGFILVMTQRVALSWYWVWIMPFVALVPDKKFIVTLSIGVSLGFLLQYMPFLYFGNWDNPVPKIQWLVTVLSIGIFFIISILDFIVKHPQKVNSS